MMAADEYHFSPVWLQNSELFVVPEENAVNGNPERSKQLSRACSKLSAQWYSVGILASGMVTEPYELTDPGQDLDWHVNADGETVRLGWIYSGMSFLVFSMEYSAAILYAVDDYKLVSGSEEFVQAYFGKGLLAALDEFRAYWHDEVLDDPSVQARANLSQFWTGLEEQFLFSAKP